MDDLVVIILTLLIAGAGALGQLKKKKQLPEVSGEQNNTGDIWDLLREEILPQEPNVENYINTPQEEFEPYENEQGYDFNAKNEGGKILSNDLKTEPEPEIKKEKIKEGFSLRKAVIYSEILNTKYI
jgi:hypothetical protein